MIFVIVTARTGLAGLDSFSAFGTVLNESLTNLPVRKTRKDHAVQ
jgi:hypothetical protein